MTGSSISQTIPIIVAPILTRLYSPEEFGIFALYVSITTIIASIATGRYELAILLPKSNIQALNIVGLSMVFSVITGLITILVVYFFNTQLTSILKAPELSASLYFMPITVFLTGIYQSLNYWNNREKKYLNLSKSKVIQASITSLLNVGMGFQKFGVSGLIVGTIIGLVFSVIFLIKTTINRNLNVSKTIQYKKMFALGKKYSDFLKFASVSALFNNLSSIGLPIIFGIFFDNAIVGLYYFASRIIRLPLKLIFNSLSQVYYQKATELYSNDKKSLLIFTWKIQLKIIIFITPFLVITSLFAPYAFEIIFGQEWAKAGEYVKYFAPFILSNSLYSPVSSLGSILNKQKQMLYFNVCLVFSQIFIIYICNDHFNFEFTLLIISIINGLQYLGLQLYMRKTLKFIISQENLK
ncbi:oligosaccharide flippase family protein [Emcibacteraceae bacterium]|nr:oligosaccharide flippase family protein [Emcibacteraceae bacterium]